MERMRRLKICIISLGVFPDHKDGSANYIRGVFDELKIRGHEVTMLTAQWDQGFTDPNILTVKVPNSRFLWVPKFARKFRRYLKKHDFDIIQANGSRGAIPVLLAKKPYIGLIHDMGPFEADFTKIPILKWLERKNAHQAKKIITNSNITKQGIIEIMGADPAKVTTVYCGYDEQYHPMPEEAAKLKKTLGLEGPVLYYVGRIAFYKGVDQIIQAFLETKKIVSNLNLVIGGKPTLKMKQEYDRWKQQYPEVTFVGMVPEEMMATYYSMADAFVTYSFASEGFGITPIEAIACGTPVICSDMPAYQEILENNALFVPRNSPKLLTDAFIDFFTHPEKQRQLIEKGKEHIKKYTWKAVVERIEHVYSEYLENLETT